MEWDAIQATQSWQWLLTHQHWLAGIIIGIAFVESFAVIGIIVPGVVLLAAAAFIAGAGALDLPTTLICAFIGAVFGDGISFLIGRYFHEHINNVWPFKQNRSWLKKGELFFEKYGLFSIVIGRFFGPIRPIMPLAAGTMHMSAVQFYVVNFLSAIAWAPTYILPGFMAGSATHYDPSMQRWLIAGAIVLLLAAAVILKIRSQVNLTD
jgi:membrane protein DedA with SNARE-associated domain